MTAIYIQVNFSENIIKATGNFGKLSGDLNIQGDCYIQVNFARIIIKATGNFGKLFGDLNIQGDCYIQVNFAGIIIKATGNFGKLSGDLNIQGDCYIQGSDNTGLTVLLSLETKKETKSNPSMCVGITAYGDFKQG